jgi:hypothetical protein
MQDLSDFIREYIEYYFTKIHTSFPGVVTEYNASTRRAIVQPSLMRRAGNREYIPFPLLIDVPVQYPGTKKWTIHFPLEKDDEVAVYFSERSLDMWKDIGQDDIQDPDPRRFDLCDAYCVPGLQPMEFIAAEEDGLQIMHKDAFDGKLISQVLMTDGKVELTYKEKASVVMEDDHITAKTEKCTAEMEGEKVSLTNGKDKINADGGNVEVDASTKATIKSPQVEITGGNFSMKGTVVPGTGPFCAIPNCLFTGAPHGGSEVSGT